MRRDNIIIKYLSIILTIGILCVSCNKDDKEVWKKIDDIEVRIVKLESLCNQFNTNICSLQEIIEVLNNQDYVKSITPIMENGDVIGYTITFVKSNPITIYHGKDGINGIDGKDSITPQLKIEDGYWYVSLDNGQTWTQQGKATGEDGTNGIDGKDGITPQLRIEDGYWYVSLDNGQTWTQQGKATGEDGINGIDGKDGITPQLKIEDGYWYVSLDNGQTWTQQGKATGEDGTNGIDGKDGYTPVISVKKDVDDVWYWTLNGDWLLNENENKIEVSGKDGVDGKDGIPPQLKIEDGYWYVSLDNGQTWTQQGKATGEDGANGIDGKDGDSMFREISQDDKFVYLTLTDGQVIQLAKWVEKEDPYLLKFMNIKRGSTVAYDSESEPLVLLWFSDIHNDIDRLKRLLDFEKKYTSYIDDVILSGDLAGLTYATLNTNMLSLPNFNNVLLEIGNHDIYDLTGEAYVAGSYSKRDYWATPKAMYDRYMANVANWNVIQPNEAGVNEYYPCYYYKDYTDNKVRLVVLDCIQYDTVQAEWFKETLADAKVKGLSVVASQHYMQHIGLTNIIPYETPFNSLDNAKLAGTNFNNGTLDIVDDYINSGGSFICWLNGHFHSDFVGSYTNHPNQLYICVGSASVKTPAQDCARVIGTSSEDLFNIIGFDVYSKTITVFRVGAIYDHYLRKRETMTLSYDPPKLINTTN